MSPKIEGRLSLCHLAEECAEVVQAAMKVVFFGPQGFDYRLDPRTAPSNATSLEREMGDVMAETLRLEELGVISLERINQACHEKVAKLKAQNRW